MTTTVHPRTTKRAPMSSLRKTSLVAGGLYLLSFVSIPTLALYTSVHDPNFMTSSTPDTPVIIGTLLEIVVALAGIGTAVALFPVIKRQNEGIALAVVGARVLEASAIFAGVVSILSVVHLRQTGAGADSLATAQALVAQYDGFFLGQGLMPAANALLLGSLLYQSRLVPRILPVLGFIGAPLLLSSLIGTIFGINDSHTAWSGLGALPVAVWEFSLGLYLVIKGFKPSPITAAITEESRVSTD